MRGVNGNAGIKVGKICIETKVIIFLVLARENKRLKLIILLIVSLALIS